MASRLALKRYVNFCVVLLLYAAVSGCARYDYTPRGVHIAKGNHAASHSGKAGKHGTSSVYIVRKGDTLYGIGRRFAVNFKALARKNHLAKPYTIYLGQRIYIKGVAPARKPMPLHQAAKKKPQHVSHGKKTTHKAVHKSKPMAQKVIHPVAGRSHIKLRWPAKGRLSSKFGPRGSRMHDGIDIAANEGVSVNAAAAGEVVYADARLTGYGNLVIIRHSTDLFTAYAHNKVNLVKRGDKVKAGQRIAYVGSTGRSTGPHLHFEVRRGEMAVDPLAYLPKR